MEITQLIIPALILSHLIVSVACAFIGYAVGTRDQWDIVRDLQNRINELEKPRFAYRGDDAQYIPGYKERCNRMRDLRIACVHLTHEKAWAISNDPEMTKRELRKCAHATKRRTK